MAAPPPPEALLRRLDFKVARRLEGLLQGDHKGPFRGQGLDLADLREYRYHDDVRHIDWNVTARLQVPHVREYMEEREITVWFLLDMSPSVDFGSVSVTKRMVLAEFAALAGRFFTARGNRVGALLFSDTVQQVVPARSGRTQIFTLLDAVTRYRNSGKPCRTDLARALGEAGRLVRRPALIFVISDFISAPGWETALGRLGARHDVIAVRLTDPVEMRLPDFGLLTFQDSESGEQIFVDTHDKGFRQRFAAAAQTHEEALQGLFQKVGVDVLELSTEDDTLDGLMGFADMRRYRAQAPKVPA